MAKKPPRRGTLASLAAELGVSRTTVSNAYNHPDQLSPELRERILRRAAARGYPGPDPTARNLRRQRADTIGVVLTEHLSYAFDDAASVDFLAGVAEAVAESEISLTLIPVGSHSPHPSGLITSAAVDGFLVYSVADDDPHLKAVLARGLPAVICGQPGTITQLPFIGIDDRAAMRPAVQALLDAGHTRFGILSIRLHRQPFDGLVTHDRLPTAGLHIQRDRILGALDVIAAAGLDAATVPIITRHLNDGAHARAAAAELLLGYPEITAVICTTDSMAFGVQAFAAEAGLSIPEDISVTGFDGIDRALHTGLTTVVQPNRAKGIAAGRALLARIADPEAEVPAPQLLPTSLNTGRTIAPPRAGGH